MHLKTVLQYPGTVFLAGACVGLIMPAAVSAGGISIHYGNGHQGLNATHHSPRGAVGKVIINRQSPRVYSHHRAPPYTQQRHSSRQHYAQTRYRTYSSPAQQYYNNAQSQSYFDSRFPNSYRKHNNHQHSLARPYSNRHGFPVVNAWEALVLGQTATALSQFADEARIYPKAGLPKVGYALSAAASGDLNQGVHAMRRAFRIDPDALRYYRLDPRLQTMVHGLIVQYQYPLQRRGRRKDEAFMLAALNYLGHDYPAAYLALQRAERDGDRSHSLRNLRYFLGEEKRVAGH